MFYKKSCSLKFRNTTASEKKLIERVKTSIFKDEVLVKETIQEPPICWQQSTNCLSVFDHFVGLALKGLNYVTM